MVLHVKSIIRKAVNGSRVVRGCVVRAAVWKQERTLEHNYQRSAQVKKIKFLKATLDENLPCDFSPACLELKIFKIFPF